MEVLSQAPQPIITCFHSIKDGKAVKEPYQYFTPTSADISGKNLQSYTFERSVENFGSSFSFTVREDVENYNTTFMDQVQPLDVIVISENGSEQKIDFIGVVTTVSIGSIASNLNKIVTVSGKGIEWLFQYYNINADIKGIIFSADAANNTLKTDLAKEDGKAGISIKDIVMASYKLFEGQITGSANKKDSNNITKVTNVLVGDIIKLWYTGDFVSASDAEFAYPISSNLFSNGKINVIDYIKRLLPQPIYEVFGYIEPDGTPKLKVREAPFDNPKSDYSINPTLLTDFTLTKSCEEVYTAFMPYVEGSSQSADFYMNKQAADGLTEKGYNSSLRNESKVAIYGYQLLTCSFVGYNQNPENNKPTMNDEKMKKLGEQLKRWFSDLDEMYSGDFTIVNITKNENAKIGEWISFAKGLFYIINESHSWTYGDNPMINYSVIRGGDYSTGSFKKLEKVSAAYREFEQ